MTVTQMEDAAREYRDVVARGNVLASMADEMKSVFADIMREWGIDPMHAKRSTPNTADCVRKLEQCVGRV